MSILSIYDSSFPWKWVIFLAAVAMLIYFKPFGTKPVPSSVQIKLSEKGVIADFNLKIKKHLPYWFTMEFGYPENDQVERARLRKLLGDNARDKLGRPVDPGVNTPINLTIFELCKDGSEVEIYSQDLDPILTSWGGGYFGKNIGWHVLTPGNYKVRLVNNRATQEFSSVPISLEIWTTPKSNFDAENVSTGARPCQK